MTIKRKRLLTHRQLDEVLDKRLRKDIDIFNIYFVNYYKRNSSPLDTGKVEVKVFLEDTSTVVESVIGNGRDVYDNKSKVLLHEECFGDYVKLAYESSKGNYVEDTPELKDKLNDIWWEEGKLAKGVKKDIKQRIYDRMNEVGNHLIRQEAMLLEEQSNSPIVTFTQAVEHLRKNKSVDVVYLKRGVHSIWNEKREDASGKVNEGYVSSFLGEQMYDDPKEVLQKTVEGMAEGDRNNLKKIRYELVEDE